MSPYAGLGLNIVYVSSGQEGGLHHLRQRIYFYLHDRDEPNGYFLVDKEEAVLSIRDSLPISQYGTNSRFVLSFPISSPEMSLRDRESCARSCAKFNELSVILLVERNIAAAVQLWLMTSPREVDHQYCPDYQYQAFDQYYIPMARLHIHRSSSYQLPSRAILNSANDRQNILPTSQAPGESEDEDGRWHVADVY